MKTTLNLKPSQELSLTPQLQQAILMLQLTTVELNQKIQEASESNPLLELEEQTDSKVSSLDNEQSNDTEYATSVSAQSSYVKRGDSNTFPIEQQTNEENLHDYLTWQLQFLSLTQTEIFIAETIIDATDDDGFLTVSLDNIHDVVNKNFSTNKQTVRKILHLIQQCDPPGIAARDLRECLLLQLHQLPQNTPWLVESEKIISHYLDLLAKHDYTSLQQKISLSDKALAQCIALIQSLNPRPGSKINSPQSNYVVPDVIVRKIDGAWCAKLNEQVIPHLNINQHYQAMIQRGNNNLENDFLRRNLQEARWLIKSITKRNETLFRVSNYIVNLQHAFFDQGPKVMKPLIIHEVAEALNLHDSTISRITNGKYMLTPQGVFELKYFFSSRLTTNKGEQCSATAIRTLIKEFIDNEDHSKPLSDNQIMQQLKQQGIHLARRTVAKYREALGILPSSQRKRI